MTKPPIPPQSVLARTVRVLLPLIGIAAFMLVLWLLGVPLWAFLAIIMVVVVVLAMGTPYRGSHSDAMKEIARSDPAYCRDCGENIDRGRSGRLPGNWAGSLCNVQNALCGVDARGRTDLPPREM